LAILDARPSSRVTGADGEDRRWYGGLVSAHHPRPYAEVVRADGIPSGGIGRARGHGAADPDVHALARHAFGADT
jgi:hypothetical protein